MKCQMTYCGREFDPNVEPGGLFITPPETPDSEDVKKIHFCKQCADEFVSNEIIPIPRRRERFKKCTCS